VFFHDYNNITLYYYVHLFEIVNPRIKSMKNEGRP